MRCGPIDGRGHRSASGWHGRGAQGVGKSVLVNAVGKAAEDARAGTIGAEIGAATVLRIERSFFPLDIAAAVGEVQALPLLCRGQLLLLWVDRPIGLLAD